MIVSQSGSPAIGRMIQERWQDVDSVEEAVDKMMAGEYAFLYTALVGFCISYHFLRRLKESMDASLSALERVCSLETL